MKRCSLSEARDSAGTFSRDKAKPAARRALAGQSRGPKRIPEPQQLYRQIVETTHEGIWMADLNGITSFANPQMARMLGTSPRKMIGRSVFEFVFEQDHASVRRHFEEFLREHSGKRVEERLRRADGSEIWSLVSANVVHDANGAPASFLGMFTDITDRKSAAEALRKSEARLQLQISRMPIGHVLWNCDFRVIAWNPAAEKMFGYTEREALGKNPHDLIVPKAARARVDEVWRRLLHGDTTAHSINENLRKDGRTILCEWSNTPIRESDGTVVGVLSMVLDITERKRAEETLRQVMDTLETRVQDRTAELRASNLALMDSLTHSVELEREILAISEQEKRRLGQDLHDDLCQQLAGIQFLSQTLARDLAARKTAEVRQAREIAHMLQNAMTQIRDLARGLLPVGFETEGLDDALRELAQRTQKVFRVKCRFRSTVPAPARDYTKAVHLYRIAQEAVGNAIKHGKAQRVGISLATQGNSLILVVSDNGVGIPREVKIHPGMGLRIMRYRAEVLGGTLTVQRQARGGTTVACAVPRGLLSKAKGVLPKNGPRSRDGGINSQQGWRISKHALNTQQE